MKKTLLAAALVGAAALSARAEVVDPSTIVTSASTTFTAVATLCVTIGTFYIGYKLAKRIR